MYESNHYKIKILTIASNVFFWKKPLENILNLYLKDFEPLLVVFGYFICFDQLNVVAVSRVANDVILHRESSFK